MDSGAFVLFVNSAPLSKLINNRFIAIASQQFSRVDKTQSPKLVRGQVREAVPVVVRRNMQNTKK